jgi:hypothetical protein
MDKKYPAPATGGEVVYANRLRRSLLLFAGITLSAVIFGAIAYVYHPTAFTYAFIFLFCLIELVVIGVFVARNPDILLSPHYFGIRRFFGVYRVRWDRIRHCEARPEEGVITLSFGNADGSQERITIKTSSHINGGEIIREINRLRAV